MMARPSGLSFFLVPFLLHFSGGAASSATCPQEWPTSELFRQEVCSDREVNVTVSRCLHEFGDEIYINYTVERSKTTPSTIAIEVYLEGRTKPLAFECENGNISDILKVVFKGVCENPVVIVNTTATVNLGVEVHMRSGKLTCSKFLIGPQRINASCEVDPTTEQSSLSVQLLNIDKCSGRDGPAVPIRMSTSINSSVTLFSDGRNETVGDISVQSLPCSDNHSQMYSVSMPFPHTAYTITAEILHALLPKSCILVTNSTCSAAHITDPPMNQDDIDPPTIQAPLPVGIIAGVVTGVILVLLIAGVGVVILVCFMRKRAKKKSVTSETAKVNDDTGKIALKNRTSTKQLSRAAQRHT